MPSNNENIPDSLLEALQKQCPDAFKDTEKADEAKLKQEAKLIQARFEKLEQTELHRAAKRAENAEKRLALLTDCLEHAKTIVFQEFNSDGTFTGGTSDHAEALSELFRLFGGKEQEKESDAMQIEDEPDELAGHPHFDRLGD